MEKLNKDFIKQRRLALDLTLKDMSDALKFKSSSTYLKYENGTYAFKAEQLPMLAHLLKCEISDFFKVNVAEIEIMT